MPRFLLALVLAASLAGCATASKDADVVRIDATSVETAEASYKAMMAGRSQAQQQRLGLAVLLLNMEGVKSAHEADGLSDPGGVSAIKDKIAGLSAEEIIALSGRVKSPRVEVILGAPAGR
ncbi:MAG TPA: hypothetical protein VGD42_00210 [Lysobacter sp.]